MHLDGKLVLVAGGAGLAGSNTVRALLAASPSLRVRATHRGDAGCFLADPRLTYLRADLRRAEDCAAAAKGCHAAVLAAAVSAGAGQAAGAAGLQVTDNIVIDAQLLQALHDAKVARAVYVSSATVYPDRAGALREADLDWNLDPPPAYLGVGWAKRAAEKLCDFWQAKTGMEIVVARPANIYGPFARFDPATANFIPALIRKAVEGADPLEVWGSASVARDVIYGEDFGAAIVALLNAAEIGQGAFNIGSGRATSVGEAAEWILRHAGRAGARIVWRGDTQAVPPARVLDCAKIEAATGWQAAIGPEEGIRRTVEWWRANRASWTR